MLAATVIFIYNDVTIKEDVYKENLTYEGSYTINSSLPVEHHNDSCMGARLGNIYIATKERTHYELSGIVLHIYNQENTYKTFMYAGQCGINERGLFYSCASINAIVDTNTCNYTSNFSGVEMLQTCKDIPEVKQYISKNPIVNSATILICDKEGRNLKIQSLCNKTIMLENNNTLESITNYPFVINKDFKIKNDNLYINGLNREQYLFNYFNLHNNISHLIKSENISQINTNNVAGFYTVSAMVVDGSNVYIYYGCPTYNNYHLFSLGE